MSRRELWGQQKYLDQISNVDVAESLRDVFI